MAVVLAGLALDLPSEAIQETIDTFRGLDHRMELAGTVGGVDFIDDSKATNVDAASRAVAGLGKPLILIGGGRHKWGDYLPLVKVSKGKVKMAILLGEAKDIMAESRKALKYIAMIPSSEPRRFPCPSMCVRTLSLSQRRGYFSAASWAINFVV